MLTFRKIILYIGITIFLCNLFSCSIENRLTKKTIQKEIKAKSENGRGELCFENDLVKIYFEKMATLKTFEKEMKNKSLSTCNKKRLIKYIDQIHNSSKTLFIFQELRSPTNKLDDFEVNFQRHMLEKLLLSNNFSVLNKKTNLYENSLTYKIQGGEWGCCNAGFEFRNGENFVYTRVGTDIQIIEDCN